MSTTPSSPFDNIMPWAGMRRVSNSEAGELVEIPKFYYRWIRFGSAGMILEITDSAVPGFYTSPAHADRGDGVGERDYVYVGRYNCASNYKSITGVTPVGNKTRATYRSSIHNLGSNVWQNDFAMYWTICMLYLVEFANWNDQDKIGYGGEYSKSNGLTDSMPYHTGTVTSSRTSYGAGVQYRYIENLWANGYEYVDGIRFANNVAYVFNNPSLFNEDSGGVNVGTIPAANADIVAWHSPSTSGYEYALVPSIISGSDYTKYICSGGTAFNESNMVVLDIGGAWNNQEDGLFRYVARSRDWSEGVTGAQVGRLMVLPSSRI